MKILNIEITRQCDFKSLYLSPETYLRKILDKFGMTNLKHVSNSFVSHYKLSDDQSSKMVKEKCYMDGLPYANLVGSIMYVMIYTRLDIIYAMSVVNIFMSNHG